MTDVFISFSPGDRAAAEEVCGYLTGKGVSCYMAPGRIVPGSDWAVKHNEAISAMRVFLLVYSESCAASSENSRELYLAKGRSEVLVIPYRIDPAPLTGSYETYLSGAECVEAAGDRPQALERVYALVREHLANTPVSSTVSAVELTKPAEQAPAPEVPETGKGGRKKVRLSVIIITVVVVLAIAGGVTALLANNNRLMNRLFDMIDGVSEDEDSIENIRKNQVYFMGQIFEGEYRGDVNKDGIANGTGYFSGESRNGAKKLEYGGTTVDGVIQGEGKSELENPSGSREIFEGTFEGGYFKGHGVYTYYFSSGDVERSVTEGDWDHYDAVNAKDTQYYKNGDIREYEGNIVDRDWVGAGKLVFTYKDNKKVDTVIYEGSWSDGNINGKVKITQNRKNGDVKVYEGGYSDGNWNGEGVLTYTTADENDDERELVIHGTWTDGTLNGTMTEETFYRNGDRRVYEGEVVDGGWHGKGVAAYYENNGEKTVREGTWDDGKQVSGTVTNYDKDGNKIGTEKVGE